MRKPRLSIVLLSLCFAMSCSLRDADQESTEPSAVASVTEVTPAAVAEIEERLSRHMTGLAPFEVRKVAVAVLEESARNRIDPQLVLAVMHTESRFYNFARSPVGALGLMQIMPATGEMLARDAGLPWSGPDDLFAPELNVRLGVRYLAELRARYGGWNGALAAYNWGPAAIDKRLASGDEMPQLYVQQVYTRLVRQ